MATIIPQVTNWTVTPQNGVSGYFTLMNTWLSESTTVISSFNASIVKTNEAVSEMNTLKNQAESVTATASASATTATQKASEASTSANQALTYKNQVMGYVVPSGASYSVEQLNTKYSAMTKAQFNALAEERKANRAGSGFENFGKGSSTTLVNVNEGIWTDSTQSNKFYLGKTTSNSGTSITPHSETMVNGILQKLKNLNNSSLALAEILLPTSPNIYPYDTVLTVEQIASGVIKHADSSNSGLITLGKNLSGTTFNQTVVVVNGKKYIIEYKDNGVRKTLEVTASSTSYTVSLTGINITEVGMYPLDAISRSDLVFLESFHEDVSEKNFVYPLGNVQYLGGNTDGLTGITNGNFTGFETYSLFGNFQASSALIGKGYVWSSLTEAQKKAFLSNPENNCYLDGDKVIQVRYRVRVVQGLGDSWADLHTDWSSGYIAYKFTEAVLKPKGKYVSITKDLDVITVGGYRYDSMITIGNWEARTSANTIDVAIAYEGKCFALPIALVHRKNQGMYHPVYNPNGTKKASDGNFWYNTAVSFTSISDCFDTSKLLTASGYIGTVSGRPDGSFYDQVHESDILDLRNSSKKVEDYNRLISREFNKLVAGATRGKEGEWQLSVKVQSQLSGYVGSITLVNGTTRIYKNSLGAFGLNSVEIDALLKSDRASIIIGNNIYKLTYNNSTECTASSVIDTTLLTAVGTSSGWTTYNGFIYLSGGNYQSTRTKANTLLHCDIIGNPTNYPTAWKQSGIFGTPLIVAEDGTSLLPDGVRDTFKLSRKANATPLLCLRSTDNGTTWTSFTPTFSTTTNEITLTNEPANNLVMVYYQTHTSMAVPVVNSEVVEYGKVLGTNGLANAHLVSTLIGKVATANTAPYLQMGYDINGYRIDTSTIKWSTTSTEIPVHSALSLGSGASGVATVKVLPYLTRLNGKAYLNLVFKEMKHNGTSWGDDNKFNIVDNVSTTTDNNAQTVLIGQKTVELPYFIGVDE